MRKSRFSEEPIIAVLKESETGVETGGAVPAPRDHAGVFLSVEEQVRWVGTERGEAIAPTGGGEPATEVHCSRTGGGHACAEGGGVAKKW